MNRVTQVSAIAVLFAILGSPGFVSPAFSQSPPATEHAKQVEALVNKAATVIDESGKASFSEFRKKDSEWFHGDTYLFVYDLKANVLLNPAFPQREGTNVTGQKDARGKLFHNAIIQVAETKGSGWVGTVSQAGSDRTLAKMGLREESDRRWHSRPSSFWVLSLIIGTLPLEKSEPFCANSRGGCWQILLQKSFSGDVFPVSTSETS